MRVNWSVIWAFVGCICGIALMLGKTEYGIPLIIATMLAIISRKEDDDNHLSKI